MICKYAQAGLQGESWPVPNMRVWEQTSYHAARFPGRDSWCARRSALSVDNVRVEVRHLHIFLVKEIILEREFSPMAWTSFGFRKTESRAEAPVLLVGCDVQPSVAVVSEV